MTEHQNDMLRGMRKMAADHPLPAYRNDVSWLLNYIEAAVAEEREACAAVAEDKFFFGSGKGAEAFKMAGEALIRRIASEIRSRGASKTSIDVLKPPRPDDVDHVADASQAGQIASSPAMTRDEALRFRAILEDAEAEIPDHLK